MITAKYQKTVVLVKSLADINRLMIVDMLSKGELCGCNIPEEFAFTQPTLSHHIKILCDSGLVKARKEGKWMYYSLNNEQFAALKAFMNGIEVE